MSLRWGCAAALLTFGCAPTVQQAEPNTPAVESMVPVPRAAVVAPQALIPVVATQAATPVAKPLLGPALDADEIVAGVDAFYAGARTLKANFTQRYAVRSFDRRMDSRGSVVFEKPDKMSWRYANGNRVVSDGQLLRIYEKANQHMYETPLQNSQFPGALSFVMERSDFKQDFEFTKLDSAAMKFPSGYTVQAQPRFATTAYDRLVFYIEGSTYRVRRVLIIDAQGNRNRYDFSASEVNSRIPEREFEFTPPAGTLVIRP